MLTEWSMTLPANRLQPLSGNKYKITLLKANVFKYNFKNVRFLYLQVWESLIR
jgi:hypothetical protein